VKSWDAIKLWKQFTWTKLDFSLYFLSNFPFCVQSFVTNVNNRLSLTWFTCGLTCSWRGGERRLTRKNHSNRPSLWMRKLVFRIIYKWDIITSRPIWNKKRFCFRATTVNTCAWLDRKTLSVCMSSGRSDQTASFWRGNRHNPTRLARTR